MDKHCVSVTGNTVRLVQSDAAMHAEAPYGLLGCSDCILVRR
jgi:hypothetical protein